MSATMILCICIAWLGGVGFGWSMGELREERRRNAEWWAARAALDATGQPNRKDSDE